MCSNRWALPPGRQTLRAVSTDFLGSLRTIAILLTVIGLVVALVAFLSGQSASARWIRRKFTRLWRPAGADEVQPKAGSFSGYIVGHRDGLRIVGGGVGILILFIAGLTWPSVIATIVVVVLWEAAISLLVRRVRRRAVGGPKAGPPVAPEPSPAAGAAPRLAGGSL